MQPGSKKGKIVSYFSTTFKHEFSKIAISGTNACEKITA